MKTENRTAEEELKTLVFKFCEWRTDKGHCFKSLSHPPSLNERWYQFQKETNAIDEFVKEIQSTITLLREELKQMTENYERLKAELSKYKKPARLCPNCGTTGKIVMFTSDEDLCTQCGKTLSVNH